ncbi:MAG: SagB/ThcOx family dehydrogenase [Halodesulfurarchaeum sp.]
MAADGHPPDELLSLPGPREDGGRSVEAALAQRRSRRDLGSGPIPLADVAQLLWAAQGETDDDGHRAAPSAGATYPMEVYLVVGEEGVPDLDSGVYRYRPAEHALTRESDVSPQAELAAACYDQEWVSEAPIDLVLAGVDARTAREYGQRAGDLYVPMEAGHVGQNVHLQVESLGLATVTVGGFEDDRVAEVMDLDRARPLAIYPIGRRTD